MWYAFAALLGPSLIIIGVMSYYYVTLSRIIEQRLHGEQTRVFPRVFARPLELHRGQGLTDRQLIDRLNDLGYTQRAAVERPGEFAIGRNAVALMVRGGKSDGEIIRVIFDQSPPPRRASRIRARRSSSRRSSGRAIGSRCRRSFSNRRCSRRSCPKVKAVRSGARCRSRRFRNGCVRRCWRSRIGASTITPASIRSAPPARCSPTGAARRNTCRAAAPSRSSS